MTEQERQLVQMVAAQVIAVLRERGAFGGGNTAASSRGGPADIKPPIGICTGDYSKFPELAGKLHAAVGSSASTASHQPSLQEAKRSDSPTIALSGIITASQLQAAMDAASDGVAVLAADARLSPLANDLARKDPRRIRRAGVAASASPGGIDFSSLLWMWWIDGSCPVVQDVTNERRARLRASSANRLPGSLAQVVRELSSAIRARQVAGGILFVHNAARAACLANRCASIRAVVGTCGEAVEQGISELGANVLIIEYPHHGHRSVSSMVDRMMQQGPQAPAAVERELADLHRCG